MGRQYQVVGHCAHVKTQTASGPMTRLLYKGNLLPDDVPVKQIRHLLSVKLIAPFGDADLPDAVVPDDVEQPPTSDGGGERAEGSESPQDSVPFDAPERVAAREKLPADGSLPDGRAGHPVWVEAAVRAGYAYDAASKSNKKELQDLLAK